MARSNCLAWAYMRPLGPIPPHEWANLNQHGPLQQEQKQQRNLLLRRKLQQQQQQQIQHFIFTPSLFLCN